MIYSRSLTALIFLMLIIFNSACNIAIRPQDSEIRVAYLETDKAFIEAFLHDFSKKNHVKVSLKAIQEKSEIRELKKNFDIFIGDLDDSLELGKNKILIAR